MLFLDGKISFLEIGRLVKGSLGYFPEMPSECYEDIKNAELAAREYVHEKVKV